EGAGGEGGGEGGEAVRKWCARSAQRCRPTCPACKKIDRSRNGSGLERDYIYERRGGAPPGARSASVPRSCLARARATTMSHDPITYMVVLNLPRKDGDLITYANSVYNHLLNNVTYPSPSPTLALFAADIASFASAAAKAAGKDRVLLAARRK